MQSQKILIVHELNKFVIEGKLLEAFEKYYHDDVVMQENDNTPVRGKEANRVRELEFLNNIHELRNASVKGLASGPDLSFVFGVMTTPTRSGHQKVYRLLSQNGRSYARKTNVPSFWLAKKCLRLTKPESNSATKPVAPTLL